MDTTKTIALTVATLGLATAAIAQSWNGFLFSGVDDVVTIDIFVDDASPQLQVTDSFLSGDWFSVRVLEGSAVVAEFDIGCE